jgi:hypothetical protein
MITTLILIRRGHPFFHGVASIVLVVALIALIVACWPTKTGSK